MGKPIARHYRIYYRPHKTEFTTSLHHVLAFVAAAKLLLTMPNSDKPKIM